MIDVIHVHVHVYMSILNVWTHTLGINAVCSGSNTQSTEPERKDCLAKIKSKSETGRENSSKRDHRKTGGSLRDTTRRLYRKNYICT